MDQTTFYDDYSYGQPVSRDRDVLKRPMTLDLNSARNSKKSKMDPGLTTPTAAIALSSPDLNLSPPDIEKFLIGSPVIPSATAMATTPSAFLFPKVVTEAQESYVQPFVHLLSVLHQSDSSSQGPVGAEASMVADEPSGYPSVDSQYSSVMSPSDTSSTNTVVIKDEPQTVPSIPCSPPVSPIDMECQEKIKLERKRQRNRVAASKCRKRKLERIANLEEKVKLLKGENAELIQVVLRLKDQVYHLKEQVVDHANSGCPILSQSL